LFAASRRGTLLVCRSCGPALRDAPHRGPVPGQLQPANRVRAGRQQR